MNPTALPASLTGRIWFFCDYLVNGTACLLPVFVRLELLSPLSRKPNFGGTGYEPRGDQIAPLVPTTSIEAGPRERLGRPMEVPIAHRSLALRILFPLEDPPRSRTSTAMLLEPCFDSRVLLLTTARRVPFARSREVAEKMRANGRYSWVLA